VDRIASEGVGTGGCGSANDTGGSRHHGRATARHGFCRVQWWAETDKLHSTSSSSPLKRSCTYVCTAMSRAAPSFEAHAMSLDDHPLSRLFGLATGLIRPTEPSCSLPAERAPFRFLAECSPRSSSDDVLQLLCSSLHDVDTRYRHTSWPQHDRETRTRHSIDSSRSNIPA
jgi:hypothetical protein